MTHDEIAELAFSVLNVCRAEGITDPLRQAHAIAVALVYVAEEEAAPSTANPPAPAATEREETL